MSYNRYYIIIYTIILVQKYYILILFYFSGENKMDMIEDNNNKTIEYKESDLPFRYYRFDYSDGFSGFQLHWHEEIEIHHIVSGSGNFFIDDNDYKVETGDIIFIAPRIIHSGKSDDNSLVDICYLVDSDYLMSRNNEYNTDKFFSQLKNSKLISPVIHSFDKGYDSLKLPLTKTDSCILNRGVVYQLEIKRHLFDFFIELYKNNYISLSAVSNLNSENKGLIKKSISYIQRNAAHKLSIDQIASHVGLSSSYFMKLFKESTNMTCVEYIKLLRLNNAVNMLKDTDDSILQVAHSCGFLNLSLFNREFKKCFSMTPSVYRKKYKTSQISYITF